MTTQTPLPTEALHDELRDVIYTLAEIHRPSASQGEREAAYWIAERLRDAGWAVQVDEEVAHGGYWWPVGLMSGIGVASGLLALRSLARRRRRKAAGKSAARLGLGRGLGVLGGAAAAVGIADDIAAGPHWFRRAFLPYKPTWNVVAEAGDPEAERTLVILAHHDAAHSGLIFHPGIAEGLAKRFPERVERTNTSLPFWYPVVGAPAIVAVGALLRSRVITRIGVGLGLAATALITDIGRRQVVPGANDNLSAVAVIIALAGALRDRPVQGVRVLLVSCGSEESLQEGVMGFARRHFPELRPDRTSFLVLDTVGSPRLVMVEAEGTLKMKPFSAELNDLIAECAAEQEIPLIRGMRARSSTDACIPNRYGYPTSLVVSFNQYKALSNYHWPTDTADNVDYDTVAECTRLSEAVIRRLAEDQV
ncbi:MAG: M28 family peptidase [Candidatus Dormiibacterota bacterium]